MPQVVIALGSNVGDSVHRLREAASHLGRVGVVVAVSRVYETAPMYSLDQPPFLNGCLVLDTELGPRSLLSFLKGLEAALGRVRRERNGPREIDLDIVTYGSLIYHYMGPPEDLVIPHPRAYERRFVLAPMADLGAERWIPGVGRVDQLLATTDDQAPSVRVVPHAELPIPGN